MKQEPVGWWNEKLRIHWQDAVSDKQEANWNIPLYTAPKELSDAEIMEVYKEVSEPFGEKRLYEIHDFARAILKKASEK